MRRDKTRAAFTLVELMIAMAVILIGMAGVAASLYFGFTKSGHGDSIATATQHSRTLIEVISGQNLNDQAFNIDTSTNMPSEESGLNDPPAADPRPLNDPPFSTRTFLPGKDISKFKRKIVTTRRGAPGTAEEFLANVAVTIYWDDKGVERSVTTTAVVTHSLPTL